MRETWAKNWEESRQGRWSKWHFKNSVNAWIFFRVDSWMTFKGKTPYGQQKAEKVKKAKKAKFSPIGFRPPKPKPEQRMWKYLLCSIVQGGFFNWSALKMTKCQITCKSLQKSSKCQNFLRVWHLVIFRADQLKKPPCMIMLEDVFSLVNYSSRPTRDSDFHNSRIKFPSRNSLSWCATFSCWGWLEVYFQYPIT